MTNQELFQRFSEAVFSEGILIDQDGRILESEAQRIEQAAARLGFVVKLDRNASVFDDGYTIQAVAPLQIGQVTITASNPPPSDPKGAAKRLVYLGPCSTHIPTPRSPAYRN